MVGKDLKKLSRAELLELLLMQTKETERLREKLRLAEQALEDRRLQVQEAGNLAQAVLAVNGVMEAAQEAAQQYLYNIVQMEEQTKIRCDQMLEEASREAERIRQEAGAQTAGTQTNDMFQEFYKLIEEPEQQ